TRSKRDWSSDVCSSDLYLNEQADTMGIEAIDIMGPMMKSMERVFDRTPRLEPGLVHKLDEDYFKRVEAIEFAVKYDDGRDSRGRSEERRVGKEWRGREG